MDINHPQFDDYREQFEELADCVVADKGPQNDIASTSLFLCLYGDNGMDVDAEFSMLKELETYMGKGLKRADVETAYWQEVVLYVPADDIREGD